MRNAYRIGIVVVIAGLAGSACNSGDDPSIAVPDTDSTSSTSTTAVTDGTGTGAPTTSTVVAPSRPASPEQAAQGLFEAWKAKDRGRAANYATERAIEQLFGSRGGPEGMEYQGCEPEGAQFSCAWRYEGGGLIMTVQDAPGGGFVVELTRFVAD